MARTINYDYYKKKVNKGKVVKDVILIYFLTVFFILLFNSLFLQAYKVPSNSMEPAINKNTRILVNKFIYGPRYPLLNIKIFDGSQNIRRGDIILFMSDEYYNKNHLFRLMSTLLYTVSFSTIDLSNFLKLDESNIFVKRVIGLPGDKIKYHLRNGYAVVFVNGILEKDLIDINYNVIEESEENFPLISSMILKTEYIVGENEFYVLGDNRVTSADSRIWDKGVSRKQIIGKAFFKYWPVSGFGVVK